MSEPGNGDQGNNSGKLLCTYCYLTSGGGTRTTAVMIINGHSLCDRHVDEAVAALTPEVSPTSA